MANKKYYFSNIDEENCWTKKYFLEEMKEQGLTELQVNLAERVLRTNYFFCKAVGLVGEKGNEFDLCGKNCDLYKPRNGKSGCCKHRGFCYEPGKEFILNINGKLLKK